MRGVSTLVCAAVVALGCQAVIGEDFSETQHYCFPFSNNGCSAGNACVFAQGASTPSCATAGSSGAGEPCTGSSGCAVGTTCLSIVGDGTACRQYCHLGADDCPANTYCGAFQTIDATTIGLCFPKCDLTGRAHATPPFGACPAGTRCNTTVSGSVACFPAGPGTDGAPCTTPNDCADGYSCASSNPPRCRHWCKAGDSSLCPGATTCQGLLDPPVFLGVTFGACFP